MENARVRPYSTISLETIHVNDAIVYTKNVVFDVNLGFRPENQRIAEETIHLARRVLVNTVDVSVYYVVDTLKLLLRARDSQYKGRVLYRWY